MNKVMEMEKPFFGTGSVGISRINDFSTKSILGDNFSSGIPSLNSNEHTRWYPEYKSPLWKRVYTRVSKCATNARYKANHLAIKTKGAAELLAIKTKGVAKCMVSDIESAITNAKYAIVRGHSSNTLSVSIHSTFATYAIYGLTIASLAGFGFAKYYHDTRYNAVATAVRAQKADDFKHTAVISANATSDAIQRHQNVNVDQASQNVAVLNEQIKKQAAIIYQQAKKLDEYKTADNIRRVSANNQSKQAIDALTSGFTDAKKNLEN